jgi:uncharacterized protein YegL
MSKSVPFINILQTPSVSPMTEKIALTLEVKILPPNEGGSNPFFGVWLLDVSGSMVQNRKIESARDSLIEQVKTLPEGTIFNLITFGSVKVRIKNETVTKETRGKIIRTIQELKIGGDTPIYHALEKAFEISRLYHGTLTIKKIILISDGEPTDYICSSEDQNETNFRKFMQFSQMALEYRISIDTVGALHGHNVLLLYELARRSAGKYIFANTAKELKEKMTIASEQATQIVYQQPLIFIRPVLGSCKMQDAVQYKPTLIRIPVERVGSDWKVICRSFESGDTYQILVKLDFLFHANVYKSIPMRTPVVFLKLDFEFGDPTLNVSKSVEIQFADRSEEYKLNPQLVKQYATIYSQAEEISDATKKGDAERTQRVQGDETRKMKN